MNVDKPSLWKRHCNSKKPDELILKAHIFSPKNTCFAPSRTLFVKNVL